METVFLIEDKDDLDLWAFDSKIIGFLYLLMAIILYSLKVVDQIELELWKGNEMTEKEKKVSPIREVRYMEEEC